MFPLQLAARGRRSSNMDPLPQLFQHFVLVCSKNQSNICKPLSQIGQPGPTMGTQLSRWGPNGPDGARKPILIDLGVSCAKRPVSRAKNSSFLEARRTLFSTKNRLGRFFGSPASPFTFLKRPPRTPWAQKVRF